MSDPAPPSAADPAISPVMQDYLKKICTAGEWDDTPVTTSRLAALVGVSASTTSEMVRKLAAIGMVTHQPYGTVELTTAGRAAALRMMRRHRLIETFLVAELGYSWDEVHDEAEVLEHATSDLLVERIDRKLGRPGRDPHGDPIPSADGTMRQPDARRLSLLEPGQTAVVARISDDDPEVLRYADGLFLRLDSVVMVVRRLPFGGGLAVRVDTGAEVDLPAPVTDAIWVSTSSSPPVLSEASAEHAR